VIPYGREVNRSLNMGQPLLAYSPGSEVSRVLAAALSRDVVTDADEDEAEEAPARRGRRRWSRGHRRSA